MEKEIEYVARYSPDGGEEQEVTLEVSSRDAAVEKTEEWLRECDGEEDHDPACSRMVIGEVLEVAQQDSLVWQKTVRIVIHGEEPACSDGEHDWQRPHEIVGGLEENPGVFGCGGGERISEVCSKCHLGRHTTTHHDYNNEGIGEYIEYSEQYREEGVTY